MKNLLRKLALFLGFAPQCASTTIRDKELFRCELEEGHEGMHRAWCESHAGESEWSDKQSGDA